MTCSWAACPRTSISAVIIHLLAATAPVHHARRLTTAAIVLAVAAALLALGAIAWGIARLLAYEPRWTLSLRHAMAEAGFRASATWAELGDWMRLGR